MIQRNMTLWLTGRPCSGKTSISKQLEIELSKRGLHVVSLDGDVVRHGLNKDLGFTPKDRWENLRRVAHVCQLFNDNGIFVIATFVSPTNDLREMVRGMITDFKMCYVSCSLEVAEKRDVKGMYKKARIGIIKEFTGVSAPFEEPINPDIIVNSDRETLIDCVKRLQVFFINKPTMRDIAIADGADMLFEIIKLSKEAGKCILGIYDNKTFSTVLKDDLSPLTSADTASHTTIIDGLKKLYPQTPVLSEESRSIPYENRQQWKEYWLIDPLDGTKEFIKRNGEFTVNIALIKDQKPVLGVVYAPVLDVIYCAEIGQGAFKIDKNGEKTKIAVGRDFSNGLKVVASRSHQGPEEMFLKKLGVHECSSMGSSLKFCLVAEGQAHLYPRFLPTNEWDTAAAQCVAQEAGAEVTDLSGKLLEYNKKELLNPSFIVSSIPQKYWKKALEEDK